MKKPLISLLLVLLASMVLLTAGCTQSPATPVPASPAQPPASLPVNTLAPQSETYTSNETLVAFVGSALSYVKTQGKENALIEFNNPNGSFVQGELYIFAYASNGTTLAHPVNPESVGKVREGANGRFVQEMGESVRNGSGFYRFVYINPLHNNTLESKMGYGVEAGDDWWLGSGVYTGPVNPVTPNGTPA